MCRLLIRTNTDVITVLLEIIFTDSTQIMNENDYLKIETTETLLVISILNTLKKFYYF